MEIIYQTQNASDRSQSTPSRKHNPKEGGRTKRENDPSRQPGREHKPQQSDQESKL